MLTTNVGIEWGMDVDVNNGGDIVIVLQAVKLGDDGTTILFKKIIAQATMQNLVENADSLTDLQKTKIVTALDNFRSQLI